MLNTKFFKCRPMFFNKKFSIVVFFSLSQYLNSKYPHLTPTEHLKHIYKLCQVHYKRNVDKNKQLSNEIRNAMYLIPILDTKEEVLTVIDKIQNCDESGAAAWAKDKLTPWVLSGISSAFTKMNRIVWNKTPNNTNAGESAHANINQDGQNLSILAGVIRQVSFANFSVKIYIHNVYLKFLYLRGRDFDKRQWESIYVYEQYNVPDSYRDKSELARQIQSEK
ncbi:unnamed protein product [Rhizophagus irregularis]|nr:unnamed protein product [Rhizophagus irregularis]